jgi:hypothetical protein
VHGFILTCPRRGKSADPVVLVEIGTKIHRKLCSVLKQSGAARFTAIAAGDLNGDGESEFAVILSIGSQPVPLPCSSCPRGPAAPVRTRQMLSARGKC